MNHDRFFHADAASLGIEANVGVDLTREGRQWVAIPRAHVDADRPAPSPFVLPPLPATLIEGKARLLRRLWLAGRAAMWVLYVDCRPPHRWHAYLPPQLCTPEGVRANLAYPGCEVPGPELRLAGTFRSVVRRSHDELAAAELPPVDGVHVCLHAKGWMQLEVFVMARGVAGAVPPHHVTVDPASPETNALADRVWGTHAV